MINTISIALSGLNAATTQLNASASNIANLQTVGSLNGNPSPYTPLETQQTAQGAGGVAAENAPRNQPFVPAFDPNSPFADENGVIGVPNVNLAEEAVNINLAEIAYKANIKVLETVSELSDELLNIFDKDA